MKTHGFALALLLAAVLVAVGLCADLAVADKGDRGDFSSVRSPDPLTVDDLWLAIQKVESNGDPNAVGDGGLAIGVAQIQPIMVEDCNLILGRELFSLADRRSPAISRLMFDTFVRHYGKGKSAEWIARAWNGGPTWYRRAEAVQNTAKYWAKVKKELTHGTRVRYAVRQSDP